MLSKILHLIQNIYLRTRYHKFVDNIYTLFLLFLKGTKIGYIKISDTAHQTTSVCFGGKNMDEMYVTSAISKNPKSDQDEGGKLFKVYNVFLLQFITLFLTKLIDK